MASGISLNALRILPRSKGHMKHRRRHTFACIAVLVAASAVLRLAAQTPASVSDPNAPTAGTLTPEQIDAQWIAANSNYDSERKRILSNVDRTIAAGPFRDDWQSLRAYQAPEG